MKKGDILWGLFVMAVIVSMLGLSAKEKRGYERQIEELQLRLAQSVEKIDTFIIRDTIHVAQTKIVEVDKTDYKKLLADKELIKDLGLKVSELEAENRTLLSTRDTVILNPINDSILTYSDRWNSFSYAINTRVLDWEVRDSLTTFVSQEYRHHFLWWKWGRKGYKVTIVNHNPRSRIEYSKYIKIK